MEPRNHPRGAASGSAEPLTLRSAAWRKASTRTMPGTWSEAWSNSAGWPVSIRNRQPPGSSGRAASSTASARSRPTAGAGRTTPSSAPRRPSVPVASPRAASPGGTVGAPRCRTASYRSGVSGIQSMPARPTGRPSTRTVASADMFTRPGRGLSQRTVMSNTTSASSPPGLRSHSGASRSNSKPHRMNGWSTGTSKKRCERHIPACRSVSTTTRASRDPSASRWCSGWSCGQWAVTANRPPPRGRMSASSTSASAALWTRARGTRVSPAARPTSKPGSTTAFLMKIPSPGKLENSSFRTARNIRPPPGPSRCRCEEIYLREGILQWDETTCGWQDRNTRKQGAR